jgi:hypothetical protein
MLIRRRTSVLMPYRSPCTRLCSACWSKLFVTRLRDDVQQAPRERKQFKYQPAAPQYGAATILYVGGTKYSESLQTTWLPLPKMEVPCGGISVPVAFHPIQPAAQLHLPSLDPQRYFMHNIRHAGGWHGCECNSCRA